MNRILIVEDSLTVRMDLLDAFDEAGYATMGCGTIKEARRLLRDYPPQMAILDIRLPDGDGIELLHEIRSGDRTREMPVVMLSHEADVRDRVRGMQTGATDYFGKPYDRDQLLSRAAELVSRQVSTSLVLLIDDSPTFRETLSERLRGRGYETVSCASGTEGLRMMAARRPDAVIVDGLMPDMRGERVIRRIRLDPCLRTTPCLLLTGSEDADAEVSALDAGADAYARKEADLEVIIARFSAMVRGATNRSILDASTVGPNRVLVVDDDQSFREALAEQLRDDGHDVVQAGSGAEAIELLAVQSVDCILLDLVMPGLSGVETIQRLKAAAPVRDIPLIALSGMDTRPASLDAISAGADDFVSKVASVEILRARVKAQIRRKKLGDAHRRVRERLLRSEHEAEEQRAARTLAETKAAMASKLQDANHELARANRELERTNRKLAAANREIEAFSYTVSHDLKAPLRAISGFGRALEEESGDSLDEASRGYLARILKATQRMNDLVDALLGLGKLHHVQLVQTDVDISALCEAIAVECREREPERAIEVAVQPGLHVQGDARLLRVLFDNLLSNAWKFTASRTGARIDVGRRDDGFFFVRDNGIGFDMSRAGELFEPFHRLHGSEIPGTGIGLATVRRIVEHHGGRVTASSKLGVGTTVAFGLSLSRATPSE